MHTKRDSVSRVPAVSPSGLATVVVAVLLLALAPASHAASADSQPAALSKQRTALYMQANHTPLSDLESDLNHLALLSETCRAEHGAQACGLPDKPLESGKLEERFAYYVRSPIEAHFHGQEVKIDRRNWRGPSARPPR